MKIVIAVFLAAVSITSAFRPIGKLVLSSKLKMAASQVAAAQPTIEEWLDLVDPKLKKVNFFNLIDNIE